MNDTKSNPEVIESQNPRASKRAYLLETYKEFVELLFKQTPIENHATPGISNMLHAVIGINGEAGELLDAMKKTWIYNKPLDRENIIEECGDILFYVQAMLTCVDCSLENCIEGNMSKLKKRYPDGYSDAAAQKRADKAQP